MSEETNETTSTEATSTEATSTEATSTEATSTEATSTEATSTEATSTEATDSLLGGDEDVTKNEEGEKTVAPEAYTEFQMPEGIELDTALLEKAQPLFKELNLTQDQAQKLVDLRASEIADAQQAQVDAFVQLTDTWREQSHNDSEIGGDNLEKSVGDGREALSKFGTPGLTKLLNDTGVGNHPEVIRFMAKVGALTKEDVPTGGGKPASTSEVDPLKVLYPNYS